MPLAGATAPVTLIGSITQHAAECISGMTIHQLAGRGSPIVWGGAPAIFDMRSGATPMGAIETAMIDAAYAQVGKSLGMPTHCYLCASDGKLVDAQAGLESGMTALVGALAGVNMISGAGMIDFLVCQSAEKLVIDAEGDCDGAAPVARHRHADGNAGDGDVCADRLEGRVPEIERHAAAVPARAEFAVEGDRSRLDAGVAGKRITRRVWPGEDARE